MKGLFVLAYAVTNLHPGAGRGYGIVDLPVQRDQIGYPMIYASAFKGPLKALCAGSAIKDSGRINCSEKPECCCLFGSEPEDEESNKGTLGVLDLSLLTIPAPAIGEYAYVQLTSDYLLKKAETIFNAIVEINDNFLGDLTNDIQNIINGGKSESEDKVKVFTGETAEKLKISNLKVLRKDNFPLFNEIIAKVDNIKTLQRALIIYTRNRINLLTKVVEEGGLWSEEYIPMGSTFLGGFIIDENAENKFCNDVIKKKSCNPLHFLGEFSKIFNAKKVSDNVYSFYINIGGKESIGKGLLKVLVGV